MISTFSPPPGDGRWFDWAARRWPSLHQSVEPATYQAMMAHNPDER